MDTGFVSLIADEPRERPEQIAVRLLRGDGAALLGVRTADGLRPLGGALHRAHDRGEILLTARDAGRAAPAPGGDVEATLAVDELAPVCGVKVHTAGVVAQGRLRVGGREAITDRFRATWPDSQTYVFTPETVQVRSTHGLTELHASVLDGVDVDLVAARRVDVVDEALTTCAPRMSQIGAAALARAGVVLEPRSVCPLSVDCWGATLLCVTDVGPRQVRATFAHPVDSATEAVEALAEYGSVAA